MERRTRGGAAGRDHAPMTPQEFEVFYKAEYPKLVKFLMVVERARSDEAEDAVQKVMVDFFRRLEAGEAVDDPAAYVQRAARNAFIKERERDRRRVPRTLQGGHGTPEGYHDDRLDAWTEQQYAEDRLKDLTPARREVAKLLMDGMTTGEIAEQLGKTHANVRQHRKQIRDCLKPRPNPAAMAPETAQGSGPEREQRPAAAMPEPRKEEAQ